LLLRPRLSEPVGVGPGLDDVASEGGPVNGRIVGFAARQHDVCDTTNDAPSVFTDVAQFNSWIKSN